LKIIIDCNSVYSYNGSLLEFNKIIELAKQNQNEYVVCIETCNLSGMPEFFSLAQENGLIGIYGVTFYLQVDNIVTRIIVLGNNKEGNKTLIKLNNEITLNIDQENIIKYNDTFLVRKIDDKFKAILNNENLIKIIPVFDEFKGFKLSFFDEILCNKDINSFSIKLDLFAKTIFTTSEFYLGLSDISASRFAIKNQGNFCFINELYTRYSKKMILNSQGFYLDDKTELEITKINILNLGVPINHKYIFPYTYEIVINDIFDFYEDLNTRTNCLIKEKISKNYEKIFLQLPKYILKNQDDTAASYLRKLALKGLVKRNSDLLKVKKYLERLDHELEIITKMNFCDYFLIVFDYVAYAKKNNIFVGCGRGSACGSLVAFVLGITDIDPIKYGLLFERFLNEYRNEMPDIDVDFEDDKRSHVIDYVINKYGKEHVVSIQTLGSYQYKLAIRDIARIEKLSSAQSFQLNTIFEQSLLVEKSEPLFKYYEYINKLVGIPKFKGTHAAGIIISNSDLTSTIPLEQLPNKNFQSQYEAEQLEKSNALKMDFLGVKNLTLIKKILDLLDKNSKWLLNINLADKKTYFLYQIGFTLNIFQVESPGFTKTAVAMKINNFNDLQALLALYRPGPMQFIEEYIKRKKNQHAYFLHDDLRPILSETYGIIIYQEQIMQILLKFSSFNLSEADIFRRAISKKDENKLNSLKEEFIRRTIKNGYSNELAIKLFEYIYSFASYGFNKAHSVAYALISYQMMYLKANHAPFFYKVMLDNSLSDETQTKALLNEAYQLGVTFKNISINKSSFSYVINNNELVRPLNSVKLISLSDAKNIENARKTTKNQLFNSFEEFLDKLDQSLPKEKINALIDANAFNEFETNRTFLKEKLASKEFLKYFELQVSVKNEGKPIDEIELETKTFGYPLFSLINEFEANKIKEYPFPKLDNKQEELDIYAKIISINSTNNLEKPTLFIKVQQGFLQANLIMFSSEALLYQGILKKDGIYLFKCGRSTRNKSEYIIKKL